mmetsp:Transcript_34078/g.90335  ORF Transcript_34078/g.90335 Transcript_34078/m.90335 type:complete len:232 (-) Transcript_34078:936-1631(-)
MHAWSCGNEALTFGSLTMLAKGVSVRAPSSARPSRFFWCSASFSGKVASTRPATEMSVSSISMPDFFVKERTMGRKAYVASMGASSVRVYMILAPRASMSLRVEAIFDTSSSELRNFIPSVAGIRAEATRSLVMWPCSTVSFAAFSSLSAKLLSWKLSSSLARCWRPWTQAKMQLRGLMAGLPWLMLVAASVAAWCDSAVRTLPSGLTSTEVISSSEPKPCAIISDCTSPS